MIQIGFMLGNAHPHRELKRIYAQHKRALSARRKNCDITQLFPGIADQYSLVTCLDGEPIGFVTWDPRHRPEYVEIGHNGIREAYKGRGYGRLQLEEALRRIGEYEGLKRIIVCTNSNLIAPKNYESAGFVLYDRKLNDTESAFAGDYLYYEMIL